MGLSPRQTLIAVALVAIVGVPILVAAYLSLGLVFAPGWPAASNSPVAPLVGEALWVRANTGAATEMRPIGPVSLGQFIGCMLLAETESDASLQDARQEECHQYLPAIDAVEYLSTQHLRAAGFDRPGFKEGHARFVTTLWITRSWTRADLVSTLAERADYGMGFHGFESAAQGYFGRPAAQLTVAEVAMLAALTGGVGPDPWCDPGDTAGLRHRILVGMRQNGAIDEAAFNAADRTELGLAPPSAEHPGCSGASTLP